MEFGGLPNELSVLIFSHLPVPDVLTLRLVSHSTKVLAQHDQLWMEKLRIFEGHENFAGTPCFTHYWDFLLMRWGKFCKKNSLNSSWGEEGDGTAFPTHFYHPKKSGWAAALIPYPEMRQQTGSAERKKIYRIRIKAYSMRGNGFIGLVPLDEWENRVAAGSFFSVMSVPGSYHVQYDGELRKYDALIQATTIQGDAKAFKFRKKNTILSISFNAYTQEVKWSMKHFGQKRNKEASCVTQISLDPDKVYCWALSAGADGSHYEVERAWLKYV